MPTIHINMDIYIVLELNILDKLTLRIFLKIEACNEIWSSSNISNFAYTYHFGHFVCYNLNISSEIQRQERFEKSEKRDLV